MVDFSKIRENNRLRRAMTEAAVNPEPTKEEVLDHTPLTFGKYKGKTPSDIAQIVEDGEPVGEDYIRWMYENVKNRPTCSLLLAVNCGYRAPVAKEQGTAIAKNSDNYFDYEDDIPF